MGDEPPGAETLKPEDSEEEEGAAGERFLVKARFVAWTQPPGVGVGFLHPFIRPVTESQGREVR